MGAGKKFKFQGSEIQLLIGFDTSSPGINISDISNANPAVVTTSSPHSLAAGDIVRITDVVGMTEVNDELFVVLNPASTTFELADVNSEDYGGYDSGGAVEKGLMSNFCELTNYNRQGGTSPEIPATSLCSTAQEFEVGLPDFGTTQFEFNFAPRTSVQGALHDFYLSGDKIGIRIVLPKNGGDMVQLGFVQQESEQAGTGGMWTASTTVRNTGNRVDLEAA